MVCITQKKGCGAMRPKVITLVRCGGTEGKDYTARFAAVSASSCPINFVWALTLRITMGSSRFSLFKRDVTIVLARGP
jgi:hypothetical protein